ncbi:MAG: histidine kinase N-terminal 7TM domain-containing protein, partial [Methanoregula sp.]
MTTFIFDLIIGMLIISGISMAALGLYGKRFVGRIPAATPYVLLMFFAAGWTVLYALELLAFGLSEKIICHNLRFLFLPYFSVLELWLVIAYVKRTDWLRARWAAIALIIPVTASVLALTSGYHTLFRYNFSIGTSGPVPILQYSHSAFFDLYNAYSLVLIAIAIILLVTETKKRGTLQEMQTLLILFALVIPA